MNKEQGTAVTKLDNGAGEDISVMLQVGKEDLANIAVSTLENKLHEFVANKQKALKIYQDESKDLLEKIQAGLRNIIEAARSSVKIQNARIAAQSLLRAMYSETQIKESDLAVDYAFRSHTHQCSEKELQHNFRPDTTIIYAGISFTGERKDQSSSTSTVSLNLSQADLPEIHALIEDVIKLAKQRDEIIMKASEVTTLISDARLQLADMDRIVREAKSAVARVALQNSANGEKLMEVINQIPGFERLTKLIGNAA